MNLDDAPPKIQKLIRLLQADRPNWGCTPDTIYLYEKEFRDENEGELLEAGRMFLRSCHWQPSINNIRDFLGKIRAPKKPKGLKHERYTTEMGSAIGDYQRDEGPCPTLTPTGWMAYKILFPEDKREIPNDCIDTERDTGSLRDGIKRSLTS